VFVGLINLVYDFCQEEYGVDMREEAQKMKENADYEPHRIAENIRLFNILSRRARGKEFLIENVLIKIKVNLQLWLLGSEALF